MASKRNRRRKACTGKVRFDNSRTAQQAAYAACRNTGGWIKAMD